jgi:RNA polymerase sigma factor (sigma-70 family)
MHESEIIALAQQDPAAGYEAIQAAYSDTVLRMARKHFRSPDDQMEVYTLVFERLHASDYGALRRLKEGPSLIAWLSVITANAARDVWRTKSTVSQPRSLTKQLTDFEKAVFAAYFQHQFRPHEIVELLRAGRFPDCTAAEVRAALEHVNELMTPTKRWALLAAQLSNGGDSSLDELGEAGFEASDVDFALPDAVLVQREQVAALLEAVEALPAREQLMLQLWFEQGMKGSEVARVIGLDEPSRIYTQIRSVLRKLRKRLTEVGVQRG